MPSTRAPFPICSTAVRRTRRIVVLALAYLALYYPACATHPPETSPLRTTVPAPSPTPPQLGGIRGRVAADPGTSELNLASPMIVYLSTADPVSPSAASNAVVEIRRDGDALSPALVAVSVGQSIEFRVADEIHHRLFSYSEPGAFDLGVLGRGESKRVAFSEPGVVHLYCSLHPAESAVVFVAPSPHFAAVPVTGEVVLSELPPGRYRLHTWSEVLPSASLNVTVRPGKLTSVEIFIPGQGERD